MHSPCASLRRARPLLGTLVEIAVPPGTAPGALDAAFGAVARVQRLMSAHDPASDLSKLNRGAHFAEMSVDAWTFDVFRLALELHRASDGVFDCAVGGRQVLAGRLPRMGDDAPAADATSAQIALSTPHRVQYRKRLQVDFGGIAKGYAVDRAIEALREARVPWGIVNAGGDLRAFGGIPQVVHVRLPGGRLLPVGTVSDGAVATSTAEDHPPLGLPVLDGRGGNRMAARIASVFAPTCALADAMTKVALVLGSSSAPLLARYGAQATYCELH